MVDVKREDDIAALDERRAAAAIDARLFRHLSRASEIAARWRAAGLPEDPLRALAEAIEEAGDK